jgi:hypothetical protein
MLEILSKYKHSSLLQKFFIYEMKKFSKIRPRTLPWDYDFEFVVEEISNINDKSQVKTFSPGPNVIKLLRLFLMVNYCGKKTLLFLELKYRSNLLSYCSNLP